MNFCLFNISQSVEKTLKFLYSCNGINYEYSHDLTSIADKLGVKIPNLVQDSLGNMKMGSKARYVVNQLSQRSYAEKQLEFVEAWVSEIEKSIRIAN